MNYFPYIESEPPANSNTDVACDWKMLCELLLQQWNRLTISELEQTHHNRRLIANLIQRKYGVSSAMAENYLRNFERTLPLLEGTTSKIRRR